jgi:hypothetical protein
MWQYLLLVASLYVLYFIMEVSTAVNLTRNIVKFICCVRSSLKCCVQWENRYLLVLQSSQFACFHQGKINGILRPHFILVLIIQGSRVSSGSIVSDYGLDDGAIGVRSPAGAKDISSSLCVQTGSVSSLLYNGYRGSFPRG